MRAGVVEQPVHDVRIVFQDLRNARDPLDLRGNDGLDRQVDIAGLVALPFLEDGVKDGFVDVIPGNKNDQGDGEEDQDDGDCDGIPDADLPDSHQEIFTELR